MKKKTIVLAIIVSLFAGLITACGDTEESKSTPTVKEEKIEEQVTEEKSGMTEMPEPEKDTKEETKEASIDEIDAVPVGSKDYDSYIHLGQTYESSGDIRFSIIDVDYKVVANRSTIQSQTAESASMQVFVVIEITNNSDDEIYIDQSGSTVFIDDYEVNRSLVANFAQENGYVMTNNNKSYPTIADISSGGRKGVIAFIGELDNKMGITEKSEIEFDIYGLIFKINPRFVLDKFTRGIDMLEYDNDMKNISPDDFLNAASNVADTNTEESVAESSSSTEIGNPIIDANPDRYIPEGITGELDVIDGTFYSNKPIIDHVAVNNIVPGEYLIVGGGNAVLTITNDYKASLKFVSDEVDFENANMQEMIVSDSALSYQVYENDTGFVISFYEGGIYLYTDYPDDENDWAEGFYELLN